MASIDTIYKRGSGGDKESIKKDLDGSFTLPIEDYSFPKTLSDFGFYFSPDGQLLEIGTDKRFCFSMSEDKKYNQKRYEALGNIMTDHIYHLLKSRCNLEEMVLPADTSDSESFHVEAVDHANVPLNLSPRASSTSIAASAPHVSPRTRIFLSHDALTASETVLVIVQGSGSVRAGVWSRRLLINEGLMIGSQLSLIEAAQARGWAVVLLNPNLNYVYQAENVNGVNGKKIYIKGHATAEQHLEYVWRHLLRPSKARWFLLVGHSYGGVALTHQLQPYKPRSESHRAVGRQEWLRRRSAFLQDILGVSTSSDNAQETGRVAALALTDSPASLLLQGIVEPVELVNWIQQNSVNWVSSDLPMNEAIVEPDFIGQRDIPKRSAGTTEHERTAVLPQECLLTFLEQRLNAAKKHLQIAQSQRRQTLQATGEGEINVAASINKNGKKRNFTEEL